MSSTNSEKPRKKLGTQKGQEKTCDSFCAVIWGQVTYPKMTVPSNRIQALQSNSREQRRKIILPILTTSNSIKKEHNPYPGKHCLLSCWPLNEVWEGVDPGSNPSSRLSALHTPVLPWGGWSCFHTRCSIPASSCDIAFLLQWANDQGYNFTLDAGQRQVSWESGYRVLHQVYFAPLTKQSCWLCVHGSALAEKGTHGLSLHGHLLAFCLA